MIIYTDNPWETTTKSGLVSIGTHKLYVSTSGPSRAPGSPAVIYFNGAGAPVATHVRLLRLISDVVRVYMYDRSGYDLSERGPIAKPTAENAAKELDALLQAMHVAPPYILVAESYGGVIAREYFHWASLTKPAIAGIVLVDAATELMFELFPRIPSADLNTVFGDLDWAELTNLQKESQLSDEEWKAAIVATQRSIEAATAEDNRGSAKTLARRRQFELQAFDPSSISVIRCNSALDYRKMYEEGVKAGNGSEEQRAAARQFVEKFDLYDDELRAAQLRLSTKTRYLHVPDCGHDLPFRRPEIVVGEIKWVLEQVKTSGLESDP
ncbi:hypothetical protein MMC19_003571 [Ptychographa xylographoides]|nr:hypothetical protein [Ptychographa xylographoides]